MKIAAIADPHANLIALQTIVSHIEKWQPDHVVVLGDIVNRGPRPAECLELILEKQRLDGWLLVRGNHEDYVIDQSEPDAPRDGPAAEVHRASKWTFRQLNYDTSTLKALPFQQSLLGPDNREIRFVHASMRGNRDGIYPDTSDDLLREKLEIQNTVDAVPAVFCVGHTHRALIRQMNDTLIANAGSAGLPFDSITLPSYAQLTYMDNKWEAEIVRLRYDLALAESAFTETGYLQEGGPLVRLVQIELRTATSHLYHWASRFQEHVLRGEISMEDAVHQYLADQFGV